MHRKFIFERHKKLILAIAVSSALGLGLAGIHASEKERITTAATTKIYQTQPGFAELISKVKPAVVNVTADQSGMQSRQRFEFHGPPEFEQFFRRFYQHGPRGKAPRRHQAQSLGSGFIIDPSGLIVTNHHVVAKASKIEVILENGDKLSATVVGMDAETDLALLRVDHGRELPYVSFGDSDKAEIGDWVLAIGNPFGLGGSATTGIISARGRDLKNGPFDDFFQVDAAINKGNSGGPLFNLQGEVIGINTAIISPNGGNVGIGFSIPAAMAKEVLADLKEHGEVERSWLGVNVQEIDQDLAETIGLENTSGALVTAVTDNSPAAAAGVEIGDVLLQFSGKNIASVKSLIKMVTASPSGSEKDILILRNGREMTLKAKLRARELVMPGRSPVVEDSDLQLELAEINQGLRNRYQIPEGVDGLLVLAIEANSPASGLLRRGDVIARIGNQPISNLKEFNLQLAEAKKHNTDQILLLVHRQGDSRFLSLRLS